MPEYLELFDEYNQPLQSTNLRRQVHKEGNWHRTAQEYGDIKQIFWGVEILLVEIHLIKITLLLLIIRHLPGMIGQQRHLGDKTAKGGGSSPFMWSYHGKQVGAIFAFV